MTNQSNIITYEIDQKVKELAEANAHIPAEEIKQDIADTETEIEKYKSEQRGWELLAGSKNDKMAYFRANNCRIEIEQREKFIEKLKCILEYRERKKKEN